MSFTYIFFYILQDESCKKTKGFKKMKDKLEALGLDKKQIEDVLGVIKSGDYVPRQRLNDVLEDVKDLKNNLKERDNQIKTLTSNTDVEDLKYQIDELKKQNAETAALFKKELNKEKARSMVAKANAFDEDLVLGLIKLDQPIEEQLNELKNSKSFLFQVNAPKNNISGSTPAISGNVEQVDTKDSFLDTLGSKLAAMANKQRGK